MTPNPIGNAKKLKKILGPTNPYIPKAAIDGPQ